VANTQENALVARAVLRDIRHTPQKARRIVDLFVDNVLMKHSTF